MVLINLIKNGNGPLYKIKMSPYRPQTNGKLERFHATLKSAIRKCVPSKREWPSVLSLALFYLRNMPMSQSGVIPYELHFGLDTPNIIMTLKSFWFSTDKPNLNVSDILSSLQTSLVSTPSFKVKLSSNVNLPTRVN